MKIKQTTLMAAALWFTTAAVSFAEVSVQAGTWKLDEAKSKFSAGATKNNMVTYNEDKKTHVTNVAVEGVNSEGQPVKWTWTGKMDGKAYKVKGSPVVDQIAYKKMSSHMNELTAMKDGKVVMTGTVKVAKDGKSRVVATTRTDASGQKMNDEAYYNKQ
ncbi:MAG: hypothetical protein ACR2G0_09195 [Chthoniobacterales bacterium]